jgi:hypothetical protein
MPRKAALTMRLDEIVSQKQLSLCGADAPHYVLVKDSKSMFKILA